MANILVADSHAFLRELLRDNSDETEDEVSWPKEIDLSIEKKAAGRNCESAMDSG